MNEELFATTSVFDWNYQAYIDKKYKTIVNSGGTYSSKTYSILQLFFIIAVTERNQIMTVVADTVPNLKKGAFRDFQRIIGDPKCRRFIKSINLSDKIVYFKSGSVIEFSSYFDSMDARSGKRDYLFINECNGVNFDVYQELATRTTKQVFLDFNPTARFWVHEYVLPQKNTYFLRSWYIHNQQLPKDKIQEIESWKDSPIKYFQNRWRVMGQGMLGIPEGAVYSDWEPIDELPDSARYHFVIDFGFNNDPCCISKIGDENDYTYSDVLCYETGLTPIAIAKKLIDLGHNQKDLIIADGGGGGNIIIAQLRNIDGSLSNVPDYPQLVKGFNIAPAYKPPGSVNVGIGMVNQYRNFIKKTAKPAWDEMTNYVRKKEPSGEYGEPVDKNNHFCDTLRYKVFSKGSLY